MKPQVFMSKRNGNLCIGLPLMIERECTEQTAPRDFLIMTTHEHIGFAMFYEDECIALWTLETIEKLPMEHLGEL